MGIATRSDFGGPFPVPTSDSSSEMKWNGECVVDCYCFPFGVAWIVPFVYLIDLNVKQEPISLVKRKTYLCALQSEERDGLELIAEKVYDDDDY